MCGMCGVDDGDSVVVVVRMVDLRVVCLLVGRTGSVSAMMVVGICLVGRVRIVEGVVGGRVVRVMRVGAVIGFGSSVEEIV